MTRLDSIYLACNIGSSVAIVLVNRIILSGGIFNFPVTLTGAHLIASGIFGYLWCRQKSTFGEIQFDRNVLQLAVLAILSLGFLNLSLMKNTVSLYQSTKLLIVPCSATFEYLMMKSELTCKQIAFVSASLVGVALVSISDLRFGLNLLGVFYALSSIVFSSLQQIYTRQVQVLGLHSPEKLLMMVGTSSGLVLLLLGPLCDVSVENVHLMTMIRSLHGNSYVLYFVLLSIALAILVNFSQYNCLGKFNVVTFQVIGHLKTIMIFFSSWLIFEENTSLLKTFGCLFTVCGIYGFSRSGHLHEKVPISPLPGAKQ